MFSMSYTVPFKGEIKTLKLERDPIRNGIGWYKDVDGAMWDVHAIFGMGEEKSIVHARQIYDNSPYYSTASWGNSYGSHEWIPYYIEIVKE